MSRNQSINPNQSESESNLNPDVIADDDNYTAREQKKCKQLLEIHRTICEDYRLGLLHHHRTQSGQMAQAIRAF